MPFQDRVSRKMFAGLPTLCATAKLPSPSSIIVSGNRRIAAALLVPGRWQYPRCRSKIERYRTDNKGGRTMSRHGPNSAGAGRLCQDHRHFLAPCSDRAANRTSRAKPIWRNPKVFPRKGFARPTLAVRVCAFGANPPQSPLLVMLKLGCAQIIGVAACAFVTRRHIFNHSSRVMK